jgi:uncharacterized protein (TIGR00255 family)
MLQSMTGYGKQSFIFEKVSYLLEVHSVNRKNLDISIFLPKELLSLDVEIRKKLSAHIRRGQVTVKLTKEGTEAAIESLLPDFDTLAQLKASLSSLCDSLGFSKGSIDFPFLIAQFEKLPRSQKKDLNLFTEELDFTLEKALMDFKEMRISEGAMIKEQFCISLNIIKELLIKVEHEAKDLPTLHRKRLEEVFKEFSLGSSETQERLSKEAALLSDKGDISEEIARLSSHVKTFEEKIESTQHSIGKVLDFLVLEMQRESNTIGAKSQTLSLSSYALAIKSEVEKIREQVQNIE